jgi:hypothetical protein
LTLLTPVTAGFRESANPFRWRLEGEIEPVLLAFFMASVADNNLSSTLLVAWKILVAQSLFVTLHAWGIVGIELSAYSAG